MIEAFEQRRRSIVTAIAVGLVGCAAAAFGIAPMTPDANDLPKRLVTEVVQAEPTAGQIDALAIHGLHLYRNDITRNSDTADALLRRLGVIDADAAAFLRKDATARKLFEGRPAKMVQAEVDEGGNLISLVARFPAERADLYGTHFSRLGVERVGGELQSHIEVAPLMPLVRTSGGTVGSTLYAATDEAHIPDSIASQMAELFSTDIDFHQELRRGDSFTVVYESMTADGEPITWNQTSGRVLAAEFVNEGQAYAAVWFQGSDGKGGYFGLDGQSKQRSFLPSPLAVSRVTSGFAMRLHPILQSWRKHRGVDYAAPTGTAVRCVGEGTVEFAGWQNGYGNVIEVQHDHNRSTIYAHLSRIAVRRGQHVEQGQTLGGVGMTGWATGPHLHFEFRVDGAQHDPMTMAKTSEALTIVPADRPRFTAMAGALRAQLDAAGNAVTATALGE